MRRILQAMTVVIGLLALSVISPNIDGVHRAAAQTFVSDEIRTHIHPASSPSFIPPGYSRKIIDVKFREGTQVRLRGGQLTGLSAPTSQQLSLILQDFQVQKIA